MRLRVVGANVYFRNAHLAEDVALLARLNADAVGLSEGQNVRSVPGMRLFRSTIDRHAREVPVLVGLGVQVQGWWCDRATVDTGDKLGPDRWFTVVRCVKEGKRYAVIATHVNAGLTGPRGRPLLHLARVRQARRHMRRIVAEAKAQRAQGWTPVLVGDWNYQPKGDLLGAPVERLWWWAPHRAFPRIGLQYESHGLDGIAFDPAEWAVTRRRTITPKGADHQWVVVDLRGKES